MVIQLAGNSVLIRFDISLGVDPAYTETFIGAEPIVREVQTMLDQDRARESIVADAVATHPGITQRQGEEKDCRQGGFVSAELAQTCRFAG
jgi:hypothetical protein